MRVASLLLLGLSIGCTQKAEDPVLMPSVQPGDTVVSWGMIGRSARRDTMYMAVYGDRRVDIVSKSPSGTMVSVEQTIEEAKYRKLVGALRKLECCRLASAYTERPSPLESRPELTINFGDVACQVALWDREWREGRAHDCAAAVAEVHGRSFLLEPVDETAAR